MAAEIKFSRVQLEGRYHGKRDWSKSVIVKVAEYFGLQPGIFLR